MKDLEQIESLLNPPRTPETFVLGQLFDVLSQLSSSQYVAPLCVLNESSLGQHTRHVIEFFQCLFEGLEHGTIDYDARKRNFLLENDLNYSLATLKGIVGQIENMIDHNVPLLLAVAYNDECQTFVETNFMREMVYMIEHSIHHYALIRIGIQENFKEVLIPKDFGVAYSTVKHHA